MKLREIEDYGLKILNERAKDGSMTVYSKFQEAEKFNKNKRFYPYKILKREVDRVQAKIESGQFLGQAGHGFMPQTNLQDVSHIVTKLEMIGNNGFATIKILDTFDGQNVQRIIRSGGRIGLSTKSVGTIDPNGHINSDLQLLSLDLVTDPSVKDATFNKENILEGVEFEEQQKEENGDTVADREEALYDMLSASYNKALGQGFDGDFKFYCTMHENGMRRLMHLEPKNFGSEKGNTEQDVKERIWSLYEEAHRAGFQGTKEEWVEKFPAIVASVMRPEKRIEKEKPKEPFKGKSSWEEVVASGFKGTIQEFKEAYPNIVLQTEKSPSPPETISEAEKKVREVEIEQKLGKAIRERVIRRVSNEVFQAGGGVSREQIKEMIEKEIKAEKEEIKELNWQAYKKLLSE